MSEKEEKQFQSSKTCWICEKLIDDDDEKVRDHYHITGSFRGASHWSWNINIQLTKKVPVIFHNSRGYDSHLVFCELNKFDTKNWRNTKYVRKIHDLFLNKNVIGSKSLYWQYAMYEF